jgi:hypothetical protein
MSRLRHEAGQTVVLFAVLLPLFLGLGAIAVDVGYWYVVKKTAQDAADAAALAAAAELPSCADSGCPAYEVAKKYVEDNMPEAGWSIEYPYVSDGPVAGVPSGGIPDPSKIEVTVTHPAGTLFGRAFGFFGVSVSRRAVAERLGGIENLAIFSHSTECDDMSPLDFAAPDVYVNGLVHANGQFRVSRGPFWAAEGTHYKLNCPSSIDSLATSQFGEAMPPPPGTACAGSPCREPNDDVYQPWPVWFTPAQFGYPSGCRYSGNVIIVTSSAVVVDGVPDPYAGAVPTGIYCAQESVSLNGNGLTGTISVLAPQIAANGDDQRLTPFSGNVLFFAAPNTDADPTNDGSLANDGADISCDGDPAITLGGARNGWTGFVFNPCGIVAVGTGDASAAAPSLTGAILADRVEMSGSRFYMNGAAGLVLPSHLALAE